MQGSYTQNPLSAKQHTKQPVCNCSSLMLSLRYAAACNDALETDGGIISGLTVLTGFRLQQVNVDRVCQAHE